MLQCYTQRNMYANPQHVEPLNLDANSFVSYSLKMQKNLVFTGGKESRTVGLDLATGEVQYHCSMEGRLALSVVLLQEKDTFGE